MFPNVSLILIQKVNNEQILVDRLKSDARIRFFTSVNVRVPLLPKSLETNRDWFHPLFPEIKTTNKTCNMKSKAWSWIIVLCELLSSYYWFTLNILHLAGQLLCGRCYGCVKRGINSIFVCWVSIYLNSMSLDWHNHIINVIANVICTQKIICCIYLIFYETYFHSV